MRLFAVGEGVAWERVGEAAEGHLEKHDPERILVAPRVGGGTVPEFGGHVIRGSGDLAGAVLGEAAGDAEVRKAAGAVGVEEDVGGFDVAVDDVVFGALAEGLGGLEGDPDGFGEGGEAAGKATAPPPTRGDARRAGRRGSKRKFLAVGSYGYLPPPNQHELGGYETWIGTCRFVPESSEILVQNLLEMLAELRSL